MKLGDIIALMVVGGFIVMVAFGIHFSIQGQKVTWLGEPQERIQIGLRGDGTVVWKENKITDL